VALPKWFKIKGWEIGGTKTGTLQYQPHNTDRWDDLGPWTIASGTNLRIDKARNPILIPYKEQLLSPGGVPLYGPNGEPLYNENGIFYGGGRWCFRLIDAVGHPISNIVCFTFPHQPGILFNVDNTPLGNIDDSPLINI